jgi:hypothetical protein
MGEMLGHSRILDFGLWTLDFVLEKQIRGSKAKNQRPKAFIRLSIALARPAEQKCRDLPV